MLILPTPFTYCNSLTRYERWRTREVNIGGVPLGGNNPIRLQSMTTTDTLDTAATVAQTLRLVQVGCEYVRITAPSIKEAENLAHIKAELRRSGCQVPLVADIHFTPNAAEVAARIVEKVRINPGNYADKKKFEFISYDDAAYEAELERIRRRLLPLLRICKEYGTALRIGTNHGSLSDRIMSRYGDTPTGMVESALEFVRFCEAENFYNIVLSMKSSNVQVMVQAYRLLVQKMREENMNYPLHLGVTEAGDGEDGRIKSAAGIGTLLEDGIGDTVRVSLTEAPEAEIPVAAALVRRYSKRNPHNPIRPVVAAQQQYIHPFEHQRRKTHSIGKIGGEQVPTVVADFSKETLTHHSQLQSIGYTYQVDLDKWNIAEQAADFLFLGDAAPALPFEIPGTLQKVVCFDTWKQAAQQSTCIPLLNISELLDTPHLWTTQYKWVMADDHILDENSETATAFWEALRQAQQHTVLVLRSDNTHQMAALRRICFELLERDIACPLIFNINYAYCSEADFALHCATDFGALLIDGLGDGIWIAAANAPRSIQNSTAFGILQATRTRISKTEYISCPSCGRTLFDLEETTAMIRARTQHLKGVKIGIMGCIVNGPGEMADADYGYVGSGVDKITLYRGKEVVKRSINSEHAVDELIQLIREDGRWTDEG